MWSYKLRGKVIKLLQLEQSAALATNNRKEMQMDLLQWAFVAFTISVMAGLLGIVRSTAVARELFGLFLVVGAVFLVLALLGVSILA